MSPGQDSKSEVTIANLLGSARTAFLAKNYADVTMDEIAEAAGVTKGALYHHFESKQALYLEMMHTDLREKRRIFAAALEGSGSTREQLRRITQRFLELPQEARDLIKLIRRDINIFRDPAREQLVRAYQATLPQPIEAVIREGIGEGHLAPADPRLLSWIFVAMVEVMLTPYAASQYEDTETMLEAVLDLFFSGAGMTEASTMPIAGRTEA